MASRLLASPRRPTSGTSWIGGLVAGVGRVDCDTVDEERNGPLGELPATLAVSVTLPLGVAEMGKLWKVWSRQWTTRTNCPT